jgi:hypothetical protein
MRDADAVRLLPRCVADYPGRCALFLLGAQAAIDHQAVAIDIASGI